MAKTRLSTKGQLILPKEVRDREVEDHGDHVVLRQADHLPETTFQDLVGCTSYEGPAHTLNEMEDAIAQGCPPARKKPPRIRLSLGALTDEVLADRDDKR